MRSDDGFGWHASRLLAQALAGQDAEVITCHQLTPELAEPLSQCSRAVFIDADAEGEPGDIHCRAVRPQARFLSVYPQLHALRAARQRRTAVWSPPAGGRHHSFRTVFCFWRFTFARRFRSPPEGGGPSLPVGTGRYEGKSHIDRGRQSPQYDTRVDSPSSPSGQYCGSDCSFPGCESVSTVLNFSANGDLTQRLGGKSCSGGKVCRLVLANLNLRWRGPVRCEIQRALVMGTTEVHKLLPKAWSFSTIGPQFCPILRASVSGTFLEFSSNYS